MSISSYKDLIAWRKAMELVAKIYEATNEFPSSEQFGLVSQLRRAAVSVPSNIAEGKARYSNRDFVRFLRELGRILSGLINSLKEHEEAQDSRLGTQDSL